MNYKSNLQPKFPKFPIKLGRCLLKPAIAALIWTSGLSSPGFAAEQLQVKFGPFEQSVTVTELEQFVKTGVLSPALKPYAIVLTPEIRQTLSSRLQFKPLATQSITSQQSLTGNRLLKLLGTIAQGATSQQLQLALAQGERQTEGLSLMAFLKAFPEKTVVIDARAALEALPQIKPDTLGSQSLGLRLAQDLAEASGPFRPTFDPAAPGPADVQVKTLTLQDQPRSRMIPVDLYWSTNTQGPLVVISHGLGGERKSLASLAHHLASYGLTVAALEHPGSNAAALRAQSTQPFLGGHPLSPQEFVERPQDISFLLDELEQLNQQPGPLQRRLNTNHVSVVGHSLGGYTGLALAGGRLDLDNLGADCQIHRAQKQAPATLLPCSALGTGLRSDAHRLQNRQLNLRDERVDQVIAINPVVGNLFGESLTGVEASTLIVSGTEDAVTPALRHQLRPFAQLPNPKYLLMAVGATHLSVCDNTHTSNKSLVQERWGEEAEPLREVLRGTSLAFIQQLTPQARMYKPFLTPAYAQSLSTPALPLRLSRELPTSVARFLK